MTASQMLQQSKQVILEKGSNDTFRQASLSSLRFFFPPFSMVVFQLMEQSLVFIITVATILWQYTFTFILLFNVAIMKQTCAT